MQETISIFEVGLKIKLLNRFVLEVIESEPIKPIDILRIKLRRKEQNKGNLN
jgi:hypothetical protein